jgi:hypothetical protein
MKSKSLKRSLSTYWEKMTHRSPGYLLFWMKHRVSQRFLDPVWLSRLNSDIQKGKLPFKNLSYGSKSSLANGQEILTVLGIHANKGFFFGMQDRCTLFLEYNKRFPESTSLLLEEADDLLKGRIHYAGEIFEIGNEPDWYIPHSILFNYLYHNSFEAFHWLKVLGKAYWLTNDPIYAGHAKKWLNLWLETIPSHFKSDFWKDINFYGTRALNLLASLILFSDVWSDDPKFIEKLLEQIYLHGSLLEHRLEYLGANHLIWQAHDLALLGLALETVFDCAGGWQAKAIEILKTQVNRQFYSDGINFELSIGYQVFVTKLIGEVINGFWKAGKSLPPQIIWRFKQSTNAIDTLLRPDCKLPLYGDSYRSNDPNLETSIDGAVPLLLGLRDRLFPDGTQIPENDSPILPWLMGRSYSWSNEEIAQEKSILHCAPESGVAVLKVFSNDVTKRSLYACLAAGKSQQGNVHAHADTLSLELVDDDGAILIDPGAYVENSDPLRTYFRSTLAHNTIRVDQQDISQLTGRFHLWPHTSGIVTGCYENKELVAVEAQHSSYLRLSARVLHKRVVILFKAKYLVILDELTGSGHFFVERLFHFAPGILSNSKNQWHWQSNGRTWNMTNTSTAELKEEIVLGGEDTPLGWFAEYRGKRVESPTFIQSGSIANTLRCMTVIASDLVGHAQATIGQYEPYAGEIKNTFQFNIGSLKIVPFENGCNFHWLSLGK